MVVQNIPIRFLFLLYSVDYFINQGFLAVSLLIL